jgi:hypothetical protein
MAKVKMTIYVSEELAERTRSAVVSLAGPPLMLTLAELAENALSAEVTRLEQEYNQGRPFPKFTGRRKPGRPVGS